MFDGMKSERTHYNQPISAGKYKQGYVKSIEIYDMDKIGGKSERALVKSSSLFKKGTNTVSTNTMTRSFLPLQNTSHLSSSKGFLKIMKK